MEKNTSESGEVAFLGFVISGEWSYFSSVMSGSLSGTESEISFSWAGEFSVWHLPRYIIIIKIYIK